jgi:hypothetical protein
VNLLRQSPRALVAAAILLVAGCAGGSGSGEITITSQNAEALAAAGVGAASMLEGMSDMVDGFSEGMFNPSALVVPCSPGNAMLSVYDMGAQGLSTGDYANVDFNACVLDIGSGSITLNGNFYLRADDIDGDPLAGPFTRSFYASYGALTGAFFGVTMVLNGGLTASLSSPDGTTLVADVSGASFGAYAQASGQAFSGTIQDFHSTRTLDTATGDYTVEFEATVYGSGLAGGAHFETTVPFEGTGDEHPHTGTLVATGALGATVVLIAVDNVNVQILVDADGDGTHETTIDTTWDALENN